MEEINFLEELSNFVFTSKYARYRPDLKRRETWDEAVSRVESMHLRKFAHLEDKYKEEIKEAFNLVRAKIVCPSMRSMQFGGLAIEAKNPKIFNCLDESTQFITNYGVRKFSDYKDGDSLIVLTDKGNWKKAIVKSYGEQELNKIIISKGKHEILDVLATKNHRWILRDNSVTANLQVGSQLRACPSVFSQFRYSESDPLERLYWCYGYIFGDGTLVMNSKKIAKYSMVRLCGSANRFLERFEEMGFPSSKPLSCKGDSMVFTGTYLKTVPNPVIDSPNLIRAFVKGYLDADGEKNPNSVISDLDESKSANLYITIQSSQLDHIEFIRNCFPIAGVYIISETDITGEETNYGIRPFTIKFRICQEDCGYSVYRVKSIEENVKKSKVWCLEVEDDQSFVLPNGLTTGNCAVRHLDSIRSFAEVMFLLLNGCGVGIGVYKNFLDRLPDLVGAEDKTGTVITYCVEDSIEGWSDSIEALLTCYFKNTAFSGRKIVFDYSKIRRKGTPLKTSGGKAPGYKGLKNAHIKIKKLLDTIIEDLGQKRLKSINAYDIVMHCSDAVLSGGVRRSAVSCLFDKTDDDMMNAKIANWFNDNPQRARSNNSVLLTRDETSLEEFSFIIEKTKQWGEPGFVFGIRDQLFNPCFEIGFVPVTKDGVCGTQFCNLTTINGQNIKTKEDFYKAVEAEAVIGTLQAAYTDFPYLGHVAEELTKNEALLGCSITAIMANPDVLLNSKYQKEAAEIVVETNKKWAKILGINQAARVTCLKPEGTGTKALGSTLSGIHPAHAKKQFLRIQCNKEDNIYKFFSLYNPGHCEESVWSANKTDDVITLPISNPDHCITKSDLSAIEHLEIVKNTQQNWVIPGTTKANKLDITHNISVTVVVKPNEWNEVTEYLYKNREFFAAVSFISDDGDKKYQQSPNQVVKTQEDKEVFNKLVSSYKKVDFTKLLESHDETHLVESYSCVGGKCDIVV